ncbi:putative bifunctional diguanylate cyclase/phosphodiesterase [Corallincola platygyrae]|uniref:Bifunctional diguanylate cyclase/phosphodiesterase n=1 Tax=Corallincola platygyrae TaxID=1193278 RepID=A0ABW4XHK4_9GAMM
MKGIKITSIRSKVLLIVALGISLALTPLLATIYLYSYTQYKDAYIKRVDTEASRLAEYMQGPMAFSVNEDAQTLMSQVSMPDSFAIVACLADGSEWLNHTYTRFGAPAAHLTPSCDQKSSGWTSNIYHVRQPVRDFSGEVLGNLSIAVNTDTLGQSLYRFTLVTLASVLVSLTLSFFAVRILFRSVFKPMKALQDRSHKVIENRDYFTELPVLANDEFGQLSKTFNAMLAAVRGHIAERNNAVHEMNLLANYDSLTGLPNRTLCMDRLQQALKEADDSKLHAGIMFLDLDHFKDVNDSLGHRLGDLLLVTVSQKLLSCLPKRATLARLGGDEFFVIIPDVESAQLVEEYATKCCQSLSEAIELEGNQIFTRASIGIALYPDHGNNAEEIMRAADAAMYSAKESGRNTYRVFENNLSQAIKRRHKLANELHNAIPDRQMYLVYQPVISLVEPDALGFEALLRWQHPELGSISPMEFIPIAESSGLILELSDFVLSRALEDIGNIKALLKNTPHFSTEKLRVAINLSAAQFKTEDLVSQVVDQASHYSIDLRHLGLEVTESLFISEKAMACQVLESLRVLGCTVSIDDFGTGYSSLAYLSTLPVDTLKIDRSFVDEIETSFNDRTITLAILRLANSLGMDVVAEGVENQAQLAFLEKQACDKAQGYFFAKPMQLKELPEWLASPAHMQKKA